MKLNEACGILFPLFLAMLDEAEQGDKEFEAYKHIAGQLTPLESGIFQYFYSSPHPRFILWVIP